MSPNSSVTNICWKVLSQLFLLARSAVLLWLNTLQVKQVSWQKQVIHTRSLYVLLGRSCSDSKCAFFIRQRTFFHWWFKHMNYIAKQWEVTPGIVGHPVPGGRSVIQNQRVITSQMHLITCGYPLRLTASLSYCLMHIVSWKSTVIGINNWGLLFWMLWGSWKAAL